MKKTILYSLAILFVSYKTSAQPLQIEALAENKTYLQMMETNIKRIDTVSDPQSFMVIANNFERIAKAKKNKWEPYYYAAYCYGVMASKADINSIDNLGDIADKYLDAAKQMNDNSEISVVAAMIIANRILVDPMSRYMERGNEVIALLEKAKHQDTNNPRPYYMQARFLVKVPEGLGGGKQVAKSLLVTTVEKFKTFSAANSIAPNWGYDKTLTMLEELNNY